MAKADIRVLPLKTSWNGVTEKGELPSRLKILNWGRNDTIYGPVNVTEKTVAVFSANQRRIGRETVPFDFNHNTLEGTSAYKAEKEPRAIAGYGRPVVIAGDGIYAEGVDTTVTGLSSARDFKDLSPAPLVDKDGTVIGMHSIALTPAGAVDGLTLEDAAQKAFAANFASLVEEPVIPDSNKLAEETTHKGLMDDHLDYFKKQMKLSAGATEKDVFAALRGVWEGMMKKYQGPITPDDENQVQSWDQFLRGTPDRVEAMTAKIGQLIEAQVKPLTAKIAELETANQETRKVSEGNQRADLIKEASKAGKVIPLSAAEIDQLPLPLLRSMISQIQPSVPLKQVRALPLTADARKALEQKPKRTMEDTAAYYDRLVDSQLHPQVN
jgi:phage I-like protein